MRARPGFYLATINQPEILLVDELMSVADKRFKDSAQSIVRSMLSSARAVVIAFHSMKAITENFTRVVVVHRGEIVFDGNPPDGADIYLDLRATK